MKKFLKRLLIFALILAAVPALIGCQLLALEHLWPRIAAHNAGKYLRENFPGNDFVIERAYYDFKSSGIGVDVQSQSSRDTNFCLWYDAFGLEFRYHTYEYVLDGTTTLRRLEEDYCSLVIDALERDDGEQLHAHAWMDEYSKSAPHGIDPAVLELDGEYALSQLGSRHGHVDCRVWTPMQEISYERAAEWLTEADRRLKDAGVGYALLDLTLSDPEVWENAEEGYKSLVIVDISPMAVQAEDLPAQLKEMHDRKLWLK